MQRWAVDTNCSFVVKFKFSAVVAVVLVSDVEVSKTDAGEAMGVVCKFFYFEVIILTWISILTDAVARRCSVKKVFLEISQNLQENKVTP